jgi:hypothetical protein
MRDEYLRIIAGWQTETGLAGAPMEDRSAGCPQVLWISVGRCRVEAPQPLIAVPCPLVEQRGQRHFPTRSAFWLSATT